MKLYHLTALDSCSRRVVAEGAFTAPRQQELVSASAGTLHLYRLLPKEARLRPLFRANVFAGILNLAAFRLPGTKRDFLIMTSDSGTLTILVADESINTFRRIHCETLGRTGMRRIVPGYMLASDPRGRACMVAALEKVKLCYVLNRDSKANLTISSALEASKSNTATLNIVAVDVGFENPVFAALEVSYDNDTSKQLAYYELDLGLNHVTRKAVSSVRESAFAMIPVPGHQDGPGGVLVISLDHITFCNLLADRGKTEELECRMPYRKGTDPRDSMVVSSTLYHDRKRKAFFIMMCTESGDLIKADIDWNNEEGATQLRVAYFDSIAAPATTMSILRAGFLSASMEGSDAALFRFENVDVNEDDPAGGYSSSNSAKLNGHAHGTYKMAKEGGASKMGESEGKLRTPILASKLEFRPRRVLKNLTRVESYPTFTSLLDIQGARDNFGRPLLLTASGRGRCGRFSVIKRGAGISDMSSHVKLPFRAEHVFAFRDHIESPYHSFVIVSSLTQTIMLKVHDGTMQEVADYGFEQGTGTVFAGLMSSRSFVQVHAGGVRFIPNGTISEATEWKAPANLSIVSGSGNSGQLVVGLSSGTVVYFELNDESGYLDKVDQVQDTLARSEADDPLVHGSANTGRGALVSIQGTPPGRLKASFFAAANGFSNRVRLFRIRTSGSIEPLGLQIAPAQICSVALVDFGTTTTFNERTRSTGRSISKERNQEENDRRTGYEPMICLISGTVNGVVCQAIVDSNTGDLLDKRTTLVGLGPVRTAVFRIHNVSVCLLLSSRSVLLRKQGGYITTLPLLTSAIHHAASFYSPNFANGMIAVIGASLRLLAFDSTEMFSRSAVRSSALPPSILPTELNLDLGYSMDRMALLGTPRRIIPITIDPSPRNQEDTLGMIGDGQAIQLFVLLQTDRKRSLPLTEEGGAFESQNPTREGYPDLAAGISVPTRWHSAIQVFKLQGRQDQGPTHGQSKNTGCGEGTLTHTDSIHLPDAACILDGAFTAFFAGVSKESKIYIVVSIARPKVMKESSGELNDDDDLKTGSLLTYTMQPGTCKLSLMHVTNLREPAHAIKPFRDMIAIGCGRSLELYSLGKKKLLKKAECKHAVANKVVALAEAGSDRVFVGDVRESVTVYKYICNRQSHFEEDSDQPQGGRFVALGSDSVPRWITSMVPLDYSSVACGDKFGNVFVLRLSRRRSSESGSALESNKLDLETFQSVVDMQTDKLVMEASIHVGSTVTGLALVSLGTQPVHGGTTGEPYDVAIIFGTLDGSLGVLAPLRRQSDIHVASSVEAMMRRQRFSLCGRDHVSFRSSFGPVKNVIDGDLCEMFDSLSWETKAGFAGQMGRSVREVAQKLEELRSSVL